VSELVIQTAISELNLMAKLLEANKDLITFTRSAEVIESQTGLSIQAKDITRWLRSVGYLEEDSNEQVLSQKGFESGLLTQFEKTHGGKKRKRAGLTLYGLLKIVGSAVEIHQLKTTCKVKKGGSQ
jgi:phage antirepressor YoqD-like protein